MLGTAENFVPRCTAVFRLRTAVLYRGIPRLDQNISNDVIFTNPYEGPEGASDNNNETAYSVHFMYNQPLRSLSWYLRYSVG